MKKSYLLAYLFVVATYMMYAVFSPGFMAKIGSEDQLMESVGASSLLLAAIFFLGAYIRSRATGKDGRVRRNFFLLLLGILFLFGFGEEISWGQRIFHLGTPEDWKEINVQGETTLHNLAVFQNVDTSQGGIKAFLHTFFLPNRMFALFWLTFCVLMPLANKFSDKMRFFFVNIRLRLYRFGSEGCLL